MQKESIRCREGRCAWSTVVYCIMWTARYICAHVKCIACHRSMGWFKCIIFCCWLWCQCSGPIGQQKWEICIHACTHSTPHKHINKILPWFTSHFIHCPPPQLAVIPHELSVVHITIINGQELPFATTHINAMLHHDCSQWHPYAKDGTVAPCWTCLLQPNTV